MVIWGTNWPGFDIGLIGYGDGEFKACKSYHYRFREDFKAAQNPRQIWWPLQIEWMESLQIQDFWRIARTKSTIAPPQIILRGYVKTDNGRLQDPKGTLIGKDHPERLQANYTADCDRLSVLKVEELLRSQHNKFKGNEVASSRCLMNILERKEQRGLVL